MSVRIEKYISFDECKYYGNLLVFDELFGDEMVWSGKYGANLVCEGTHSIIMTLKTKEIYTSIVLKFSRTKPE